MTWWGNFESLRVDEQVALFTHTSSETWEHFFTENFLDLKLGLLIKILEGLKLVVLLKVCTDFKLEEFVFGVDVFEFLLLSSMLLAQEDSESWRLA